MGKCAIFFMCSLKKKYVHTVINNLTATQCKERLYVDIIMVILDFLAVYNEFWTKQRRGGLKKASSSFFLKVQENWTWGYVFLPSSGNKHLDCLLLTEDKAHRKTTNHGVLHLYPRVRQPLIDTIILCSLIVESQTKKVSKRQKVTADIWKSTESS